MLLKKYSRMLNNFEQNQTTIEPLQPPRGKMTFFPANSNRVIIPNQFENRFPGHSRARPRQNPNSSQKKEAINWFYWIFSRLGETFCSFFFFVGSKSSEPAEFQFHGEFPLFCCCGVVPPDYDGREQTEPIRKRSKLIDDIVSTWNGAGIGILICSADVEVACNPLNDTCARYRNLLELFGVGGSFPSGRQIIFLSSSE